jgi:hypothetical protein
MTPGRPLVSPGLAGGEVWPIRAASRTPVLRCLLRVLVRDRTDRVAPGPYPRRMKPKNPHKTLEVMVLQKGRHRFEWHLCDDNGATIAQGNSISVAEARSKGLRARQRRSEVAAADGAQFENSSGLI